MSDYSHINSDRPATCLTACLDVMDHCVDIAGIESAVACFKEYSRCADDCDGIERPEEEEGQ